ncbi:unnamed protein product [Pleuronectes platessa]|uniref:Uncharacterized protein n=1 Tax=Pleuronectes platessa TaxID=8262 RepID=A0A9N7U865_PLEPL|nr:unnamed protein product [Pleuronectes platessa]
MEVCTAATGSHHQWTRRGFDAREVRGQAGEGPEPRVRLNETDAAARRTRGSCWLRLPDNVICCLLFTVSKAEISSHCGTPPLHDSEMSSVRTLPVGLLSRGRSRMRR